MKTNRRSIPFAALLASALIAGAAGASTNQAHAAQAPGKTPPANTGLPTISGSPSVGATLTASSGTWSGKGLKYSFEWHRCDSTGADCAPVAGGQSYSVVTADTASRMRVVVTASNSGGSGSATSVATAAVNAPASSTLSSAVIGPAALPGATAGVAYSQAVAVTGGSGSHTVRVTQGTLTPGLQLTSSGSLAGTPTSPGTFAFTISAFDSAGTYVAFRDYTFAVAAGTSTPPPAITPSTLAGATVGTAYAQTLAVSNHAGSHTLRVIGGALAPGVLLSTGGLLSGTPSGAGAFAFTVAAYDANGAAVATGDLTLSVTTGTLATEPSVPPLYSANFDNGLIDWNTWIPYTREGITVESAVGGRSGKALRLRTVAGTAGSGAANTNSVALFMGSDKARATEGQHTFYRTDVYLPSDITIPKGSYLWLTEWHVGDGVPQNTQPDGTVSQAASNALGLVDTWIGRPAGDHALYIRLRGGDWRTVAGANERWLLVGTLAEMKGRWLNFVYDVVWSRGGSGRPTPRFDTYLNGTLIHQDSRPNLFTKTNGAADALAFGVYNYHVAAPWTMDTFFDNLNVGTSFASVANTDL